MNPCPWRIPAVVVLIPVFLVCPARPEDSPSDNLEALAWGDPVQDVRMAIVPDRKVYLVGEPILFRIYLRNDGSVDGSLVGLSPHLMPSDWANYRFKVHGYELPTRIEGSDIIKDRPTPLTEFAKDMAYREGGGGAVIAPLPAGRTVGPLRTTTPLNRFFDMSLPGLYKVQLADQHAVKSGDDWIPVWSNVVEVRVVEHLPQPRAAP